MDEKIQRMLKDEQYIKLFQDKYVDFLTAANGKLSFQAEKILVRGGHTGVALGKLDNGEEVVMKCYFRDDRTTQSEINYYNELNKLISDFPVFYSDFKLGDCPVLILEKLEHLDKKDDPCDVGIAILQMLKSMHKVTIHNGIKPENIMKRKDGVYFLIDYGGVAEEKCDKGYIRRTWSPLWTCQTRGQSSQVTTPKHDFIELAKTLMHLDRKGDRRIKLFAKVAKSMCKCCSWESEKYDRLISILR